MGHLNIFRWSSTLPALMDQPPLHLNEIFEMTEVVWEGWSQHAFATKTGNKRSNLKGSPASQIYSSISV